MRPVKNFVTIYKNGGAPTQENILFTDDYITFESNRQWPASHWFVAEDIVCLVAGQPGERMSAQFIAAQFRQQKQIPFLNGHFLIALYLPHTKQLSIFRDLAGFEHGYYWHTDEHFIFSTSLRQIIRQNIRQKGGQYSIDARGLGYYLTFQYLPSPHTMFQQIYQIPPASQLQVFPDGHMHVSEYRWFPPLIPRISQASWTEHVTTIQDLLKTGLQAQVDPEKKVIAFLSGGMDTSTNVALLVEQLHIKPTALTAVFAHDAYNEFEFAEAVAKKFNIVHTCVEIKPDLIEQLPEIAPLFENPIADRSILAEFLLCRTVQDGGYEQLVTGEGGDEILGFPRTRDEENALSNLPDTPEALAGFYLELTALSSLPVRRMLLEGIGVDASIGIHYLQHLYTQQQLYDRFEQLYFGQWKTWLIDNVYMKETQLARHFNLKLILPFMDTGLMNYMSQIPTQMKKEGLYQKQFVKDGLRNSLPFKVLHKPKHKFWLPMAEWFQTMYYPYLCDTLLQSNGFIVSIWGKKMIHQLIQAHKVGEFDHNRLLWALLFLEAWYAEFARPLLLSTAK